MMFSNLPQGPGRRARSKCSKPSIGHLKRIRRHGGHRLARKSQHLRVLQSEGLHRVRPHRRGAPEVDAEESTSGQLSVPQPYVAVVDPQGGKKDEPGARRANARPAAAAATKRRRMALGRPQSCKGFSPRRWARLSWLSAGNPPRWLAFGIGSYLASQVEPRSPYYRQLRQTAFANWQQGWPTRANEALGGSDQITPDGLRAIAFALVECMMSPEMKQGFPTFVSGMLAGHGKARRHVPEGLSRHPRRVHQRHRRVDRPALRKPPMTGGEPAPDETGLEPAVNAYFLPAGSGSRHVIFPGVEILDDRRQEPHALGRPLRAPIGRGRALASSRTDGHPARGPARIHHRKT